MDEFDLTPEEEEEMRTCFWEIVKNIDLLRMIQNLLRNLTPLI